MMIDTLFKLIGLVFTVVFMYFTFTAKDGDALVIEKKSGRPTFQWNVVE